VLAAKSEATANHYDAFFPIQLRTVVADRGGFTNKILVGGWPMAGYGGFICRPAAEDRAIPAFAEAIKGFNWSQLALEPVLASNRRFELLTAGFPEGEFTTETRTTRFKGDRSDYSIYPYVELPDDFETYLQTHLGGATRSTARKVLRKLNGVDFAITHATPESLGRDIDILMGFWETKWRASKGEWALKRESADHRVMFRASFDVGEALVIVLWQGDRPIGAQGTIIDAKNRALRCLAGSRDLSVKKPSPGFLIHLDSIRWGIGNGFRIYDLLAGNHTYKYDFGVKERHVARRFFSPVGGGNLRGKLDPRCLNVAFERARLLAGAGRLKEALAGCRQVLDQEPDNGQARRLAAELKAKLAGAARDDLRRVVELLNARRAGDAVRLLDQMVMASPRSFDIHHLLGVSLLILGRFDEADSHFARALEINANVAPVHVNRGHALLALGKSKEALASFKRALALDPSNAGAHTGCGEAMAHQGRYGAAVAAFDKALRLDPTSTRARHGRDEAAELLGKRR